MPPKPLKPRSTIYYTFKHELPPALYSFRHSTGFHSSEYSIGILVLYYLLALVHVCRREISFLEANNTRCAFLQLEVFTLRSWARPTTVFRSPLPPPVTDA